MAKTNDGNLLQHFVECQIAQELLSVSGELHLVCTHAMAPFEEAESKDEDAFNRSLHRALESARETPTPVDSSPPVRAAYARTRAALDRYPNTAELIAALAGDEHLRGTLCEKDEIAASVLSNRWAPTHVRVRPGNWRAALAGGALEPPEEERPWLITLDPYAWLRGHEADKASRVPNLCKADLELLRPLLGRYAGGTAPGALVVCVYQVDPEHAADFRRAAISLADRLGLERAFLGVPARDGTRHLAAVLSPTEGLAARTAEAWSDFRREPAPE